MVFFSAAVDVTGTPQLELDFAGTPKAAACGAATNTTTMLCSYTVVVGDSAPNGIAIAANKLTLNGGTITATGSTTNTADLAHAAVAIDAGQKVDGIRPTLVTSGSESPTTSTDGTKVILTFSEPIGTVTRSLITIEGNSVALSTSGESISGPTVELTLTTALTDSTTNLTVALAVEAVEDGALNGNLALAATAVTNAVATTSTAPTVSGVALTSNPGSDSTYAIDDDVEATVTFSAAVDISGAPRLELDFAGSAKQAACATGTNVTTMVCSYEVAAGDSAPNGVAIAANKLTLNGGTITATSSTTTTADLDHAAVAIDAGHTVDGIRPTLVTTGSNAPKTSTDGTKVILTFSEDVSTADRTNITIRAGGNVVSTSAASGNGPRVVLTLTTALTSSTVVVTVALGADAVEDAAGNGIAAVAATGVTNVVGVSNLPPTVSATASPSTVYGGDTVALDGTASDPDGDPLTYFWTSDGSGTFAPAAFFLDAGWIVPATETAHTVNLTLTATDTGGLSASVTVSVLVEPFPQPYAATDLQGTALGGNSVILTWTIPSQPQGVTIKNVQVRQRMSGGAFDPPSWDTVVTLQGDANFTGVSGLAADTEYFFRIRLTTTHGLFADSRPLNVRTLTGAPAPRRFDTVWPTQTSITLDWSTVETAAEYKLEYRKDGETEWTRISGDFDHLPSTTDHRQASGVAAGLDCNTRYDFRLSVRGSGDTRNDGNRYPSTLFGSYAATSAQTGQCAQEERVTNLLVSIEPRCATLTWTPPSGDRDTGYRVERYSYTDNRNHRSEPETLVEQANRVAARYEDCSAEYRTDGAEHVYSVTALDNDPEPDEEGAFGTAYTSLLVFGPSREPEGPRNVRLTHDRQRSRGLAWDAPWDPWLTTVKTARAGSGPQQVVTDPWTTGYRVERREYRRLEDGGWALPEFDPDEPIWSATMTVGSSTTGTPARGYFGLGDNAYGALTQTTFTHPVGSGSWEVVSLGISTAIGLRLNIREAPPYTEALSYGAFEHWVLVVDGRSFPFEVDVGGIVLTLHWPNPGLSWADGQEVSVQLVERERFEWDTVRDETDGATCTSFTDSTDKGDRQYVYRVWAYNDRGLTHYSWRGDWAFNGGDPGGDPEPAEYIPPPPAQQQGGETPSNTPATGAPAISGTPRVGETLTANTSGIEDEDGLDDVTYSYQWIADGSDIAEATGSSHTLSDDDEGKVFRVRVSFTDDSGNGETLTSAATAAVAALPTLTATFPVSPYQSARHNGAGDRPQVVVAFSLPVASLERTTPPVSLTGATVSSVRRHEEDGLENAWMFFLDPDGNDDIVFSLVAGQPCDSGGICTGDGTPLSAAPDPRVLPGPEGEEDEPEPPSQEQEQAGDDQQTPQSPPPAPINLTATVNADGHIVLSWTAPDDDSITGYQILRRRPSEGEGALLVYVANTQGTATTFTDTGVTAGGQARVPGEGHQRVGPERLVQLRQPDALARIHRRTGMDGVRTLEGGRGSNRRGWSGLEFG